LTTKQQQCKQMYISELSNNLSHICWLFQTLCLVSYLYIYISIYNSHECLSKPVLTKTSNNDDPKVYSWSLQIIRIFVPHIFLLKNDKCDTKTIYIYIKNDNQITILTQTSYIYIYIHIFVEMCSLRYEHNILSSFSLLLFSQIFCWWTVIYIYIYIYICILLIRCVHEVISTSIVCHPCLFAKLCVFWFVIQTLFCSSLLGSPVLVCLSGACFVDCCFQSASCSLIDYKQSICCHYFTSVYDWHLSSST
jgi:hypothetical protein